MRIRIILFVVVFITSFQGFSQETEATITKAHLYSDYVADENGVRLSEITVRIRGKNISTKTNSNGEFTIKASIGDIIILSKNGKIINSYIYDGSLNYEVEDKSGQYLKNKKSTNTGSFKRYLDSAKFYVKSDPDKSILYIEKALKLIKAKRGSSTKIAQAYTVLGDVYINLKQYDLAVDNYKTALKNKKSITTSLKLAQSYALNNEIKKSNTIFNELLSKKIAVAQKLIVFEGLGDNYKTKNNYTKAILNYNEALLLAQREENNSKISDLNSKIGAVYSLQGQISKAQNYFDNTIKISKKEPLKKRAIITNSVANEYRAQQNFDKEIALKKQTLEELEQADINEIIELDDNKITVQQLNLDIGNAYAKKKSYYKAINYLEKSKKNADKALDVETKKEAVKQLSEIYKNVGNFNKALNSYQEYVGLVDILYKKKEKEIKDAIALSKDLAEKQNRINSLEKDRELLESKYRLYESEQQVTIENYKRQQTIIYSLLIGLLLLLVAIYFMYKSNKQRRLSNNLLALKSLRSQMNPHFIFNALNSVNSFIAQNNERLANRYLTEFSALMRNVLDNSEKDFIPLSKEIELLELYLKLEHSRFKDKFDYEISIDKNLNVNDFQIPPMLIQPYVENAVWHGLRYKKEKGNLRVIMKQKNKESITIEISDDGIGRKKSKELKTENQQKQQSKGMKNIKKRVSILNEMYRDKVAVFIDDLNSDTTGTKVVLTLKKD